MIEDLTIAKMIDKAGLPTETMTNNNTKTIKDIFVANRETMANTKTIPAMMDKISMEDNNNIDLNLAPITNIMTGAASLVIGMIATLINATITATAITATVLTSLLSDSDPAMMIDNRETMDMTQDRLGNMTKSNMTRTMAERPPSLNQPITTPKDRNSLKNKHHPS